MFIGDPEWLLHRWYLPDLPARSEQPASLDLWWCLPQGLLLCVRSRKQPGGFCLGCLKTTTNTPQTSLTESTVSLESSILVSIYHIKLYYTGLKFLTFQLKWKIMQNLSLVLFFTQLLQAKKGEGKHVLPPRQIKDTSFHVSAHAASQDSVTHSEERSNCHLSHTWAHRCPRLVDVTLIDREEKVIPSLPLREHSQICS